VESAAEAVFECHVIVVRTAVGGEGGISIAFGSLSLSSLRACVVSWVVCVQSGCPVVFRCAG
jgi:hypothetical protein